MEKSLLLRKGAFYLLVFLIIFPILHILFYSLPLSFTFDPFLLKVVTGALLQSVLSTGITLVLALIAAFGLLNASVRWRPSRFRLLSLFIAAPSFFPPLIVVLLGAYSLGFMPTGLWGVVYFHVIMNVGLVSVLLFQTLRDKSQVYVREAIVWGVSRRQLIVRGLLPEIRHDIRVLIYFLMVLYFFSFSIPMLVGGMAYGGIEVFIYEKIMLFGEWGEAILYSLGLFFLLFLASRLTGKSNEKQNSSHCANPDFLKWLGGRPTLCIAVLPSLYLAVVTGIGIGHFLRRFDIGNLGEPFRGTLIIGLGTGLILFFFFTLLCFSFLETHFSRFLLAMISPGWVIVAFSFLLIGGQNEVLDLGKTTLALAILYLPYLFRLSFYRKIKDLSEQVKIAQTFPVSWNRIFLQILWPQCLPMIGFLSGVGALWACGDFAVSGILLGSAEVSTLALQMKNMLSSYRIEQAILLLLPLLAASLVVFGVYWGIAFVSCRKVTK